MKSAARILLSALLYTSAHADFIRLQVNSSADFGAGYGASDTIGGNGTYNVYLSQDNGVSFLNFGDGPTTSILLPTTTIGTFTYQLYCENSFANALTLQLWSADQGRLKPDIVISTVRDTSSSSFAPIFHPATIPPFAPPQAIPPGAMQATIGDYVVTLKEFAFTNGSGPATAYSVTPGTSNSPEIIGHFSYSVTKAGTPTVFVDGVCVETNMTIRGSATLSLTTTFPNGTLLYTLDDTEPDLTANLYVRPFVLKKSATLRAVAYNADFTKAESSEPLEISILPTLTAATEGGGIVEIDPPSGAYLNDGTAVVTARPAPGWTFLQWLGDVTGTNPIASLEMTRNRCVQAVFGTALSNIVVGSGSVVWSQATELYPYGTTVRLTAVPQAGNYFVLWGIAGSGTNNPLTIQVTNANPIVTAVFTQLSAGTALSVAPNGLGRVEASPRGNRFSSGTTVTLTAVPENGQSFLGWSGDATGTNNPLVVTMSRSRNITAEFTKRPRLSVFSCAGVANDQEIQLVLTGELGQN